MSDKKPKLWESTFGNDDNDSSDEDLQSTTEYSRVQQKERKNSNKVLVWSLALVLLVIMCLPIAWSAISAGSNKTSVDHVNHDQVAVSSKPKSAKARPKKQRARKVVSHLDNKHAKSHKNDVKESESDTATQQQPTADDNTTSEQATAQQAPDSNTSQADYYVVKPHDNAYRIALNHGLTTEQLYQLNGLSRGTILRPGMQLKVQ
ncbi:LysM peptidoglycan-binding domain-containing protein [Bombilactobacillus thymidiniphilus]|uniref:LysM peptidoglycan-binding domain-containing protein n=1 Tax=Bombilactobacillus thymidiniphilus TaxID=2923363 RepID=A0ABY4PDB9_9LACO|nr:LysM domain-containing protein [Bombilactobacillus thymidiniphilus]UQS83720.1 LysM peptidoglycan-binding domain-containing protein [Bombilactobacillus thymidiniphilus]